MRWLLLVAWSVLAVLLASKPAFATQPANQLHPLLILNTRDSATLMSRMKIPARSEIYRGQRLSTKRFATSDKAIRIDCAHSTLVSQPAITCSVTLDASNSATGVTAIKNGYIAKSYLFSIQSKKDIASLMALIDTPYFTTDNLIVKDVTGKDVSVARFYINCPRDWVFDVVACEGHLVVR